jgi:hypothetical protein
VSERWFKFLCGSIVLNLAIAAAKSLVGEWTAACFFGVFGVAGLLIVLIDTVMLAALVDAKGEPDAG